MDDKVFFERCLKEISGRDAYEFLAQKASEILGHSKPNECIYIIVEYYFENEEHFDCSFREWLRGDNGPIVRYGIKGLFPELELVAKDKFEVAKLAKEFYDVELKFDWEGDFVYSLEFNFKEINPKRVKLDEVREVVKAAIFEKLREE